MITNTKLNLDPLKVDLLPVFEFEQYVRMHEEALEKEGGRGTEDLAAQLLHAGKKAP